MQNRIFSSLLGACIVLAGCGAPPNRTPVGETLETRTPAALNPSGFLSDYSKLSLSSRSDTKGAYVYRNKTKSFGVYTMVILEPVKVHLRTGAEGQKQSPQKLTQLAGFFEDKLRENLGDSFPVVAEPGYGVMRIRAALVDATPTMPVGKGYHTAPVVGEAAMEMEILDSVTGEQLAAAVDSRTGRWYRIENLAKEDGYTKDLLSQWAMLLRNALDDARGLQRGRGL